MSKRDSEVCPTFFTCVRFFLFDRHENIHVESPVCISGQYTYVKGLCNFFFIFQDLIYRIDSYFQRIAFQRNFLLTSNTLRHKFFPM